MTESCQNPQMCCTCSHWTPNEKEELFGGSCDEFKNKVTAWYEDDCGLWEDCEHIARQTMAKSNIMDFIQAGMREGFNETSLSLI